MRHIAIALVLPLALSQWAQGLVLMACWGPRGSDADLTEQCYSMADHVSQCRAEAQLVPEAQATQTFYDCLVRVQ